MVKAAEKRELSAGEDLLQRLLDLNRQTLEILGEARRARKPYLALKAIGRAEAQLELQARLAGEIKDRELTVNVLNLSPETAERMARIYLERRGGPPMLAGGAEPPVESEVIE